ncbi:hypothetical protein B0I12_000850 [Microbacterium hydrothermale]|uniref:hypothetical protein n=1 Tax=Microbacterium hydrothermale TaxID=857427 RepID=UPI0022269442|nr:hypothetical protein [Microbacterium hydrothermale]MCW2163724.1 hypothetical protein [Microbacterium hydrothermale]
MTTATSIRTARGLLIGAVALGLALFGVSLAIGASIPGLIAGAAGWALVLAAIVWLLVRRRQRAVAAARPTSWRPGDEGSTQ